MKKNGYVNNRLRMNKMIKNKMNKNIQAKTPNKNINKNTTSQRYLNLYQNEKSAKKNMLTPDINNKNIKRNLYLSNNKLKHWKQISLHF